MNLFKPITRPFNSYNLFFILERAFLLEERHRANGSRSPLPTFGATSAKKTRRELTGYEFIDLPPLPPRYRHLEGTLPPNWYDPGRNKVEKRKHEKTHACKRERKFFVSALS